MVKRLFVASLLVSLPLYAAGPPASEPSGLGLADEAMQAYRSQAGNDTDEYHAALGQLQTKLRDELKIAQSKLLDELKIAQKQAFRQESLTEVNDIQQMIDALPRGTDSDPTAVALSFDSTVFVCQASGAMLSVFPRLKEELTACVGRLQPMQDFNIVVFHGEESELAALNKAGLLRATTENKTAAGTFTDRQGAMGGQDPIPAIRLAFGQHPDKIVLLTDGFSGVDSKQAVIDGIRRLNAGGKTKIDAILFDPRHDPEAEYVCKTIAEENGGTLRIVDVGF